MKKNNAMRLCFESRPENEAFARVVVSAFMVQLNPTLEEVNDVKTAVSEAVTNAIVHGYPRGGEGEIRLSVRILPQERTLEVEVSDDGEGIPTWSRRCSLFIRPSPSWSAAAWVFRLCKASWTAYASSRR